MNALSNKEGLEPCYTLTSCSGRAPGTGCSRAGFADKGLCEGRTCAVASKSPTCTGYRLPTSAEWEYVARAGSATPLYSGALDVLGNCDSAALDDIAWFCGDSGIDHSTESECAEAEGRRHPATYCGVHPVGAKKANAWGLHDVLGNVREWVEGAWANDDEGKPQSLTRGCSWWSSAGECRLAQVLPSAASARDNETGFRPVRTLRP